MRALTMPVVGASLGSLLLVAPAAAQCVDLPLPNSASTRGLAMGNANLAARDDDVIFYGPAQLAVARGTSVAAERYLDGLASGTAATTSRLATGGIGVSAEIAEGKNSAACLQQFTLPNGAPAARTISRAHAVVGAAQTYKRIRFGLAANYATETADDQRLSGFLVDAGVARDFSLGDDFIPLTAALAVQSIGGNPTNAFAVGLPRTASIGVSSGGPVGPFDIAVMAQGGVEHSGAGAVNIRNRPLLRGGVEVGYTWLDGYSIALRLGERTASGFELSRHTTFGAGLVLDRFAFDYAMEQLAGPHIANRFGVRLR